METFEKLLKAAWKEYHIKCNEKEIKFRDMIRNGFVTHKDEICKMIIANAKQGVKINIIKLPMFDDINRLIQDGIHSVNTTLEILIKMFKSDRDFDDFEIAIVSDYIVLTYCMQWRDNQMNIYEIKSRDCLSILPSGTRPNSNCIVLFDDYVMDIRWRDQELQACKDLLYKAQQEQKQIRFIEKPQYPYHHKRQYRGGKGFKKIKFRDDGKD